MKTAIYARMSTDKQSTDSPADQIARCREYADRKSWHVVEDLVVTDEAISGASRHNRFGLLHLIARIDDWDVLLCYDFTRLARDSEDLGWIRNRLRLHKRNAYEVTTGLDAFNVGAKVMGVLGDEYLVKLRQDTHRGHQGRVERGFSGGGLPYGYRSEPIYSDRVDHRGEPVPDGYRWVVDPEQATVLRRIFELFVGGWGCKRIAHRLNAEHVPPPTRCSRRKERAWSQSGLQAMVRNPIYRGEYIWNKTEKVKDHETGKRRTFKRPESEWVRVHDEAWRIVPEPLWARVQATITEREKKLKRDRDGTLRHGLGRGGSPRYALSGLLECGECGGGFHQLMRDRWTCGRRNACGLEVCGSRLYVPRAELEKRILGAIESQILVPEHIAYVVAQAVEIVRQETGGEAAQQAKDERRLEEIGAEIEHLVELAAELGNVKVVARQIADRERERGVIKAKLATVPCPIDFEVLAERIEARVTDLRGLLAGSPAEAREALGQLFGDDRIRVYPDPERRFRVEAEAVWPLGDCVGTWTNPAPGTNGDVG